MTTVREQAAGARGPQQKKMKVAVAGLGAGAVQVVRAMENAPYLEAGGGRRRSPPGTGDL